MAEEVAGAPNVAWGAAPVDAGVREAPPSEGNGDLEAESPPAEGILNIDGALPVAGGAPPKAGLAAVSAVVDGVVDSAGLGVVPNKLEPPVAGAAEGVPPNTGLLAAVPVLGANRPPDGCVAAGVVEGPEAGVFDEAVFIPPKRLGLDAGGGPAGVVEVLPNKELPAGAGVADALPPNKLPPEAGLLAPAPKSPLVAGCPDDVDSVVLFGVWAPPNRGWLPPGVLLLLLLLFPRFPKLKPVLPPLGLAALGAPPNKDGVPPGLEPALSDPNIGGLAAVELPLAGVVPNGEAAAPPLADEAPTFPNRPPPPELGVEAFWFDPNELPDVPKRPPLGAPLDAGAPNEKDMAFRCRDQGIIKLSGRKKSRRRID